MSLQVTRVISATVLFFGTFFSGVAPALIKWYVLSWGNISRRFTEERWIIKQSKMVTSFFMCFGGGVLFATCFIHLLPELHNTFEMYWAKAREIRNVTQKKGHHHHSHHFPLPEFIMCAGFLFVYALEEVIYYIICKFNDVGHSELVPASKQQPQNSSTPSNPSENGNKEESDDLIESDNNKVSYGTVAETNDVEQFAQTFKPPAYCPPPVAAHDSQIILFQSGLSLRGILAVIALSFHSLFEGLSVGMQRSEGEIWTLLFAIAIHKFVIAVVIGIETVQTGTSIKVVVPYMLVFSLMSPIGMLLAIVAYGSMTEENGLITGSLVAIATGTLIYVTFFEILLKERNSELPGNWQLLGMFVGFIIMTLIDNLSTEFHINVNS